MIGVIDYETGNIHAVCRALAELNTKYIIVTDEKTLKKVSKVILPGVGSFDISYEKITNSIFFNLLNELVITQKIHVLGICVGFQIMLENSAEGHSTGLGWINGSVKRIKNKDKCYKLPHIGWSRINVDKNSRLLKGLNKEEFFFLHSYETDPINIENVTSYCEYENKIICSIEQDNILGVQFHPEKSFSQGLDLFNNFVRM